eukprot:CAMPEP_0172504042 /NCGR_PEP_ID=MMETSP1066-20121228/174808_1 /TAXON_ID=671091 /ORGANISM="Coscinodiscus wailesii, Strain CCMP2513" /LENGTH=265 /DNA_ID=CAMNT_0013280035 /DNA_START=82 /DNA_END=876 /DNA_ORIENTATION=+
MADKNSKGNEEARVVLEQNLLRVRECFVYTIPPMKSSGGHRAEDWNLANPLATCSLDMIRQDSTLLINILSSRPKNDGPKGATENFLFAQSKIKYDDNPNMQHWVENVVDSSRYFVVRISDEKRKREAHIGLGFRERNDATDFKMGLMEYVKMMKREKMAEEMIKTHDSEDAEGSPEGVASSPLAALSKLTLKEGEKIHVSLPTNHERHRSGSKKKNIIGKGGLLLKKPPTGALASPSSNDSGANNQDVEKNENNSGDDGDEDEW